MNRNLAAPEFSFTQRMFLASASVGTMLGLVAFVAIFWPYEYAGGAAEEFLSGLAAGSWVFAIISALCGLVMGILCSAAMYVAMEIQSAKGTADAPARKSTASGLGALVAALLPAIMILAMGFGEQNLLPFALTALGFIIVCFVAGFGIVKGLNRCQVHG